MNALTPHALLQQAPGAPLDAAVISVGYISGGSPDSPNVIPAELVIAGTARSYSDAVRTLLEQRIIALAESTAAAWGCQAEARYHLGPSALINQPEQTKVGLAAAIAIVGAERVNGTLRPTTGGEDFAEMMRFRPGAFVENLTIVGATEADFCLGDHWRVGGALLEVSQGRQPCWKLNVRFDVPDLARRVLRGLDVHSHPSSYFQWLALPQDMRVDQVAANLERQGILVSTSEPFATAMRVPHAMRLVLSAIALDVLEDVLRRVRREILG